MAEAIIQDPHLDVYEKVLHRKEAWWRRCDWLFPADAPKSYDQVCLRLELVRKIPSKHTEGKPGRLPEARRGRMNDATLNQPKIGRAHV